MKIPAYKVCDCGHSMISTLEEDYEYRGMLKPRKYHFIMHHCPNCMDLKFEPVFLVTPINDCKVIFS